MICRSCRRKRLRWRRLESCIFSVERARGKLGVEERRRGGGERGAGGVPRRAGAACWEEGLLLCSFSFLLCLTDCFEIKRHLFVLSSGSLYLVQACSRPSLTGALMPSVRRASETCGNETVQQQHVYHVFRAHEVMQAVPKRLLLSSAQGTPTRNMPLKQNASRHAMNSI